MIKAFLITGILAVIFGFISLVVLCLSDKEEVMEAGAIQHYHRQCLACHAHFL